MMLFSIIILWTLIYTFIPYSLCYLFMLLIVLNDIVQQKIQNVQESSSSSDEKVQDEIKEQSKTTKTTATTTKSSKRLIALNTIQLILYWWTSIVSKLIELCGKLMHSYEVVGLEHIPKDGPALLIVYHGTLPTDMIYFTNQLYRKLNRYPHAVADRFLFIFRNFLEDYIFSGPASKCIQVLKDGHLLAISPGGTREAQFATNNYEIIWNNRCGYARVAKAANVPIIPIFTKNSRQMYILPKILQQLLRPLYEWIRIPVVPIFGGFPVKLITYVGEPIEPDRAETPEELARITQKAMEYLITSNQTIPATIFNALKERFVNCDKIE